MSETTIEQIGELLDDLDFPAAKQEIVDHARRRGARPDADRALSALPRADYRNRAEVLASVPKDPAPERDAAERAYQQRHHRKPGLAEHMREAERPPVEEELDRRGRHRGRP